MDSSLKITILVSVFKKKCKNYFISNPTDLVSNY